MDIEEEGAADAATACKRQKRNNSSDGDSCNEDDSEAGTSTAAAAEAAAAAENCTTSNDTKILCSPENAKEAKKTVNSHSNNNNDSGGKGDELDTEEQGTDNAEATTKTSTHNDDNINQSPNSTPTSSRLSVDEPATQVDDLPIVYTVPIFPNSSPVESEIDNANNDDDDHDDNDIEEDNELGEIYPIFNRPRMLRTRAYRSTLSDSVSSSDLSTISEHNLDASSDTNDTNDTEVEADGDGDGDADGNGTDETPEAINFDYESRSPAVASPADSSSGSSDLFWHRYYASSNEEVDSDDEYNEIEPNQADKEQVEIAVNKIIGKSKPSYTWNCVNQLIAREHNLYNRIEWRGGQTDSYSFGQGFYGSRQVIERMKLMSSLNRHRGCVNCLNFNRSGELICSGSDDLLICVWDWAREKPLHSFKSGHTLNIFQTKFIDSAGCLDIVSSSRDGQVRRAVIPPSGSSSFKPTRLYTHGEAVHKVVVVPQNRHEIMSAGEDAAVKHFDLRSNKATTLLHCVGEKRRVRLFSIAHHPYAPEFCISGSDDKLRVYDKRKLNKLVHEMTPKDLKDTKITQITCAVYNHSGSEILASYSDAGIYLYDSRNYKDGEFLHSYEGHINSRTIKGVNFFGPHSEFVVSGSDCGHIFFWDKNTESVINFMKGDISGCVNCLEPHPWSPVLATSGLEHNVKIWTPAGLAEHNSTSTDDSLRETLQRNFRRSILDVGDFDINQIHYFIRQLIEPRLGGNAADAPPRNRTNLRHSSSDSSSSSSNSSNSSPAHVPAAAASQEQQRPHDGSNGSSSDEGNADPLGCRTQ